MCAPGCEANTCNVLKNIDLEMRKIDVYIVWYSITYRVLSI